MKVIPLAKLSKHSAWKRLVTYLRQGDFGISRELYEYAQYCREQTLENSEVCELLAESEYLVVTDKALYLATGEEIVETEVKKMREILKKQRLQEEYVRLKAFLNDETQATPTGRTREPIPDDVRISVWRRDDGRCVKCGRQDNLEYDHIIPWSKGGSNTARNLQLLCETCNRQKSDSI